MTNPAATSIPSTQNKIAFPTKRNQGFLEKWLIPDLKREMYKMSLEHFSMGDSKEATKTSRLWS